MSGDAQRGHFERIEEATLRGLNRDKVIEQIATRETEVEVQQEVVNRLDNLLDTEQRQLWDAERALTRWRDVLAQIDALPPEPAGDCFDHCQGHPS